MAVFGSILLTGDKERWVKRQVEKAQRRFSRFRPDSETNLFNRGELPPSKEFWDLLKKAMLYYIETDGLFSPFLGYNMCKIGYDTSFEFLGQPRETGDHAAFIDFGGLAKSWIAQTCCQQLLQAGCKNGLIDAGGDIITWGTNEGDHWRIGIADPFGKKSVATLALKTPAGVATSNTLKRSWVQDDQPHHHIIDPRTGLSVVSDCVQCTMFAENLTDADVYAKVLLLLGMNKAPAWLKNNRPELAYIMVAKNEAVTYSDNLQNYCHEIDFGGR